MNEILKKVEERFGDIDELFLKLDSNKNTYISREEIKQFLEKLIIPEADFNFLIWNEISNPKLGIKKEEFPSFLINVYKYLKKTNIPENVLEITEKEYEYYGNIFNSIYKQTNKKLITKKIIKECFKKVSSGLSEKYIERVINLLDDEKIGVLDKERIFFGLHFIR
jgi:Ca2+-binding EF-hand superfamily protein